jgi:hypothetical protein
MKIVLYLGTMNVQIINNGNRTIKYWFNFRSKLLNFINQTVNVILHLFLSFESNNISAAFAVISSVF